MNNEIVVRCQCGETHIWRHDCPALEQQLFVSLPEDDEEGE